MIRTKQKRSRTKTHRDNVIDNSEPTDNIKERQRKAQELGARNMAKRGFNTDGTRTNTRKKRMKEVNKHRFNGRY